jgi:DNA-binding NarL/FixJ family response regulator
MIRVLLAEDHQMVRQGLRALLEKTDDIEVIGEADDGAAAVTLTQQLLPDVLVMDLQMPQLNGIQAMLQLHTLDCPAPVIILSMYGDETLVRQAMRSGARGYVLKRAAAEELLLAIRAAHQGDTYLSPAVAGPLLADFLGHQPASPEARLADRLSVREYQVLQMIAEGQTNSEIAKRLQIAVKTVEKHRGSLMSKLQVHSVAGLMRTAIQHGLIMPEP